MTESEHDRPTHGVANLDDWQGLLLYDRLLDDTEGLSLHDT